MPDSPHPILFLCSVSMVELSHTCPLGKDDDTKHLFREGEQEEKGEEVEKGKKRKLWEISQTEITLEEVNLTDWESSQESVCTVATPRPVKRRTPAQSEVTSDVEQVAQNEEQCGADVAALWDIIDFPCSQESEVGTEQGEDCPAPMPHQRARKLILRQRRIKQLLADPTRSLPLLSAPLPDISGSISEGGTPKGDEPSKKETERSPKAKEPLPDEGKPNLTISVQ
eukprot:GHVN01001909.1.p3 GENE.GHVN01001909.1~~GHVN01001909.1.p3  ORF type:complete len:226 (-),score=33.68 GHVN01001909.1:3267-3944(-)